MNRRDFLSLPFAAPALAAKRKPNILVILADDLGYSDLGCYGGREIPTPHIDSLARGGVRCTSGYVSGPYCSPTRAGLLTGRYQQRFGHEFNAHSSPNFLARGGDPENQGLPLTELTFVEKLRGAGYTTGIIGKWHLGDRPKYHPLNRGFDEFFGFLGGARPYFPGPGGTGAAEVLRNHQKVEWNGYLTDLLAREAVSFIERRHHRPFFLYLAFNAVHTPMQAAEPYLARFAHIADQRRRTYAAMLAAMDDAVGSVLAKLKESGVEEDTLVFFLSDNGGPTNKYAVNGSINSPLRGSKGDTWEGGVRVPMIVRWPARLNAGRVYERPVIQLDIAATSLVGAEIGARSSLKLDGVDLVPFLTGKRKGDPHSALFWRFGEHWAVRMGDWKAVHTWDNQTPELYDLRSDLAESTNLAARQPEKLKALMAAWQKWNRELAPPAWPRPEAVPSR